MHLLIRTIMEFMIGMRPRPMLQITPSTSTASALLRNKSQFRHVRISRSPGSGICACGHSPVPPRKNDDDGTIKGSVIRASFALACALGAILSGGLWPSRKAIAGPREMYQKAPQAENGSLGGREAMRSLLETTVALSSSKMEPPPPTFLLPPRPSMEEVKEIKMHAVQLMRHGKPEEAVNFLQEALNDCSDDPEPAYHVEMALVEVLICQGKYKKALQRNCLDETQRLPSDARFPLYKAIIYTMLDKKEEAKRWWDEYVEAVEGGFDPIRF